MFHRVMIAALAIGAAGGASIAVAEQAMSPATPAVAEATVHRAADGAPCLETPFRVYFRGDSADLDEGAQGVIDTVAARVAGCERLDIRIGASRAEVDTHPRRIAQRAAAVVMALEKAGVEGDISVVSLADRSGFGIAPPAPAFIEATVAPTDVTLVSGAGGDARLE